MADYYTKLSLLVPLPNQAAQTYALGLVERAGTAMMQDDPLVDGFPAELQEVIEDWRFETQASSSPNDWGLWLYSEDGGIDAVCAFVQHLLQRFDPQGHVTFEWSNDCSKPRVDAYGGGAALITAEEIKTMTTGDWLHREATHVLPELVAALEMAEPAVEYYHDHEGCPETLKTVRGALQHAQQINPPLALR